MKVFYLIVKVFGLKGSWNWACRKMDEGYVVRRKTDSGTAKYSTDKEGQRRIQWTFDRELQKAEWEDAYIFISDFENTSWEVCGTRP